LTVSIPLDLAREIFSESGNLPTARFPATIILAETIGKALPTSHEDTKKRSKPTIITRTRKPRTAHRKPFDLPILTR
jgi:hypothetical protein